MEVGIDSCVRGGGGAEAERHFFLFCFVSTINIWVVVFIFCIQ